MRVSAAFFITSSVAIALAALSAPAFATSGPGCLRVVNIEAGDVLNIRRRPDSQSRIVDSIDPANQGILHLDGKCRPTSLPWRSRWCPVSYYSGGANDPAKGWVKARYVQDNECP